MNRLLSFLKFQQVVATSLLVIFLCIAISQLTHSHTFSENNHDDGIDHFDATEKCLLCDLIHHVQCKILPDLIQIEVPYSFSYFRSPSIGFLKENYDSIILSLINKGPPFLSIISR